MSVLKCPVSESYVYIATICEKEKNNVDRRNMRSSTSQLDEYGEDGFCTKPWSILKSGTTVACACIPTKVNSMYCYNGHQLNKEKIK